MANSVGTPSLERFLTLASDREQTIAANMANVDTPGYKTKDLNFKQELARAAQFGNGVSDTVSGISNTAMETGPSVSEVQGLMERPDGNNVNLDRESLLLSQTQLQYQMGIQLVKGKFHQLLSAINGGN